MTRWGNILLFSTLLLLGKGCTCKNPVDDTDEKVAAFNADAWEQFEAENFTSALSFFDQALALRAENAEALTGSGWCFLLLDSRDSLSIGARLDSTTTADTTWQTVAWTGLATLRLSQTHYAPADSLAGLALQRDSTFVFAHRTQVDWRDLLLIEAQSRFLLNNYTGAWASLRRLVPGTGYASVDPANSSTWTVDGKEYALFETLLADAISDLINTHGEIL